MADGGETLGTLSVQDASAGAETERAVPEERAGQYTRVGEIGRGGQSIVHCAVDEFVGREVALKELLPAGAGGGATPSSAARERFLREARLTAQLDHPSIVAVHELGRRADGTLFCAQKLVRGETLQARLARCESLEQRLQLLPHLIDACNAIAYAHSRGVIHRDLKPSNIMVGAFGETVVVDWGLAKKRGEADPRASGPSTGAEPALTAAGVALGTPAYMSPEQARCETGSVDERSDVFSLGAILYELLTGRRPFAGATAIEVMERVAEGRIVPAREICPEAPVDLVAVAERALRRERAERYPGAEPLARDLSNWRAGGRVEAYEYRSIDLLKRFVARNRALSSVAAAALAVLIGSSIVIGRQLASTRASLAQAFIDRAEAAERDLDWGRAAAFYAASRVQRDSQRAQWGLALDLQRMPRKTATRALGPVAFAEVGMMSDGRALLFTSPSPGLLVAEEATTGQELWRAALPPAVNGLWMRGALLVAYYSGEERWRAYDPATGRMIAEGPETESDPCIGPPAPPRALWRRENGVWRLEVARSPEPAVLARTAFHTLFRCAVSADGSRLAAFDGATLVLWDLDTLKEIARRQGVNYGIVAFTRHGLAVAVGDATEVMGGPQGDFSIPSGAGGYPFYGGAGRSVLGFLFRGDRADVIDLEERRIASTLALPSSFGPPHAALSDDGARLVAITDTRPAALNFWTLPRPISLQVPVSTVREISLSRDGARFAVVSGAPGARSTIRVWTREGKPVRTLESQGSLTAIQLSSDGSRVAGLAATGAEVWDVRSAERLLEFQCRDCLGVVLSADGSLALASGFAGVTLWDVARRERRWGRALETRNPGSAALSDDGALAAWTDKSLIIAAAGSGAVRATASLDDSLAVRIAFSHDGRRIAAAGLKGVMVWRVDGTRLWSSALVRARFPSIRWSSDDSKLILADNEGSMFDSSSGELLAHVDPEARSPQPRSVVSTDLRYVVKRGQAALHLQPLPAPEDDPPSQVLASVLEQAGLELRGAELVTVNR